eukprot:m51a1_g3515 hypothetical protein (369) ;mRNA; f:905198-906523
MSGPASRKHSRPDAAGDDEPGPRVPVAPAVRAWLLSADDPLARYSASRLACVGCSEGDREDARQAARVCKTVERVFRDQKPDGHWLEPDEFYSNKYKASNCPDLAPRISAGTVWAFLELAELGVDWADEARTRRAAEFLLEWSQDRQSGAFAYCGSEGAGGDHAQALPCLTGNMAWAMLRLGMWDDPRVQRCVEGIARWIRFDDGETRAPKEWPYVKHDNCWGRHACMMGIVKCLKALAEVPEQHRSDAVRHAIDGAVEFVLVHRLFKSSHDPGKVANDSWLRLSFPRFWGTDILEMLVVLVGLGVRDARMQDAIDALLAKRTPEGLWVLEGTNKNGRMQCSLEKVGDPSRWLTMQALHVLDFWEAGR